MVTKEQIAKFLEYAHQVGQERLQLCSSGNLSWRIADDIALVSGTGSWLPRLAEENVAVMRISDKSKIQGSKPSMEHNFHLGVMLQRKDVNVVLHFQSQYATTISCMKNIPADFNVVAEVPCYSGRDISIVPYHRPGSPELAQAVVDALKTNDCALLRKHGQVVCGKDFDDAFQKAVFFEFACGIIVNAGAGNYDVFTKEEIADLDKYILGKSSK